MNGWRAIITNYKERFNTAVDELIESHIDFRPDRITFVSLLVDDYVRDHGEVPPQKALEKLADYILYEELTNKARNKISAIEYPIMSERQLSRRYDHEYAESLADTYDGNGRNRAKPERRVRTSKERNTVDQEAKIRNRARAARYRKFIGKQPLVREASEPFTECVGSSERWLACIGREETVEEREITKNAA